MKSLKYLLSVNSTFHLGATVNDDGELLYVLIAQNKKLGTAILSKGKEIPFYLKLFSPLLIRSDMGSAIAILKTAQIGSEDPDTWIDRHEELVVPKGFTSDQIVNEYAVFDSVIYSGTISKIQLHSLTKSITDKGYILETLSLPLWNLAIHYSKHIEGPFCIWKITERNSILGFVNNGKLQSLHNFWAGHADLKADSHERCNAVDQLLGGLTCNRKEIPVITIGAREDLTVKLQNFTIASPPEIPGLEEIYHESYAAAVNDDPALNYASFESVQKARTIKQIKNTAYKVIWGSSVAVITTALVLALTLGSELFIKSRNSIDLIPLQQQNSQLEKMKVHHSALMKVFTQKAKHIALESATTSLISDLQNVFPDGMWAEEISISEVNEKQWNIDIRALSISSTLLNQFFDNLKKLKLSSDIRVVYTEQVEIDKKKLIRCKVEAMWGSK